MADHVREQILDAMVTALTGLTTTGARVFRGRARPLTRTELPGLVLRIGAEQLGLDATELNAPRITSRQMTVKVFACVAADEADVDTALNAIFLEVEPVLAMPVALGGAHLITLRAIAEPLTDVSLEQPVGQAAMLYEVIYYTQENAPDVAL